MVDNVYFKNNSDERKVLILLTVTTCYLTFFALSS